MPSASQADSAGTASGLTPLEAVHLVGAAGEPGFLNGSANANGAIPGLTLPPVSYYKDHEGIVHLEGLAAVGKAPGEPGTAAIFNLPAGFRPQAGFNIYPSSIESLTAVAGSNLSVESLTFNAGDVVGVEGELAVLTGITFRAVN